MGGSELSYIQNAFDSNWIAPLGANVDGFEHDLETFLSDSSHVAVLSSGTAAIHLALKILGVEQGDEVICQSFTFCASANPITYMGAEPVFVDSEYDTWNMSPELLDQAITERIRMGKKPKAIIVVDLYGMPYKVNEINGIAANYGIPILEDSAEALGSSYHGKKCGILGDLSVLSFNGNKIITTSGGGALVLKDEKLKEKVKFLATQASDITQETHYQHTHIGYNYRMSNILAGIGRGQMEVLNDRISMRRTIFSRYKEALETIPGIEFLEEMDGFFSNRWLTCILTANFEVREQIRNALKEKSIESRPLWRPMHLQPVYRKSARYTNGVSEDLFNKGLCLPSGSNLTENEQGQIIEIIKSTVK